MNREVTINCSESEIYLIERALDFYSRVGMGQFEVITDHPTFDRSLDRNATPQRPPQVGDRTPQGEILEIKEGKALINGSVKDGKWCSDQEWKDLDKVKLSCDYGQKHIMENIARNVLNQARNILYGPLDGMPAYGSWGIFNEKVDKSCVIAFHLLQIIRHERWKNSGAEKTYGVDNYPANACRIGGLETPNFNMEIKQI